MRRSDLSNCRALVAIVAVACLLYVPSLGAGPTGRVDLAAIKDWDIVRAKDAIPSERYAAEELQKFFAEGSGVKLAIVTEVDRPGRHIFIGPSEAHV